MGYRIGEVAGFLDITPDTIRYYEKEGIIHPTKNPLNGYREYSFEDITRLSDVLFYRNVDFSIGDIRKTCFSKSLSSWRSSVAMT